MAHEFDKQYWEDHWQDADLPAERADPEANPYLTSELVTLTPGTALDAGCGEGAAATWLADRGWQVTGVDISAEVLARAERRDAAGRVRWVEADLSTWTPGGTYDLVMTHYAHPAMPQLDFYERLAGWVAPGGTLLVVGHLPGPDDGHPHSHGHGHQGHDARPAHATATAAGITARLDPAEWEVVTADEHVRTVLDGSGRPRSLHDVVVRAGRRA